MCVTKEATLLCNHRLFHTEVYMPMWVFLMGRRNVMHGRTNKPMMGKMYYGVADEVKIRHSCKNSACLLQPKKNRYFAIFSSETFSQAEGIPTWMK